MERVQINKFPFDIDPTYTSDVLDPLSILVEEIEKLKDDLEQAQREKENLEHELYSVAREKNHRQQELDLKDQQIQRNREVFEKESLKRKLDWRVIECYF